MQFFSYMNDSLKDQLFFQKPLYFDKFSKRELLAYALGATLYMPALRPNIHIDILTSKYKALTSLVLDLEDAIGDLEIENAEKYLVHEILALYQAISKEESLTKNFPLIFLRIRDFKQFKRIQEGLGEAIYALTGIVVPKFSPELGEKILDEVKRLSTDDHPFYALPILESEKVIKKETRLNELWNIKLLLDEYKNNILNIRIGATDFSGLYGLRRKAETTVYDIAILRDCIADIVNIFQRADHPYVISGSVYEYFTSTQRNNRGDQNCNAFLREILLDIENGLVGKTIIHPSQIKAVQALNVVAFEEYMDALHIVEAATGEVGVLKSQFSNKMNEIKPHYYWAKKLILKSKIYGVLHDGYTSLDLIRREVFI